MLNLLITQDVAILLSGYSDILWLSVTLQGATSGNTTFHQVIEGNLQVELKKSTELELWTRSRLQSTWNRSLLCLIRIIIPQAAVLDLLSQDVVRPITVENKTCIYRRNAMPVNLHRRAFVRVIDATYFLRRRTESIASIISHRHATRLRNAACTRGVICRITQLNKSSNSNIGMFHIVARMRVKSGIHVHHTMAAAD